MERDQCARHFHVLFSPLRRGPCLLATFSVQVRPHLARSLKSHEANPPVPAVEKHFRQCGADRPRSTTRVYADAGATSCQPLAGAPNCRLRIQTKKLGLAVHVPSHADEKHS